MDVEEDLEPEAEFDCLLTEIAQLDQRFEQGEIDEESYRNQRELLMTQAKAAQATAAAGTAATAADSDTARENELAEK